MERKTMKVFSATMAALLFPGLGHLILGKWVRAVLFAFSILLLFYLGLRMEGRLHTLGADQFIELLLFLADISTGIPYFVAKNLGYGVGNLERQTFDYGTTYLAVAGLCNLLATLNVYDIAVGRKK